MWLKKKCFNRYRSVESGSTLRSSGSLTFWFGSVLRNTTKNNVLCLFLFESTLTSFFKVKKSERSHRTIEIKDLFIFLFVDGRIRIRIRTNKLQIRRRIQEAPKIRILRCAFKCVCFTRKIPHT